jgi:hypothetical protein
MSVVRDWLPVVSTGLAAVAASAAWFNVRQSRQQWRAERTPNLVGQLADNPSKARVDLEILNTGPGDARGVRFCVVIGGEYVSGYAGPNFGGLLRAGETAIIATELRTRSGSGVEGVCTCLDATGRGLAFDFRGGCSELKSGRSVRDLTDPEDALSRLGYGQALASARRVGGRGQARQS